MQPNMTLRIIRPADRWQFSRSLMEMHHHRKQVFVDQLGWKLVGGGWLEVDEFDNDYATYLMVVSPDDDRHLASVRLLPTTRPHMLNSVFSDLVPGGAPQGETVWEISRFIAAPGEGGASVLRVHRMLAHALVEFALLNGVERYTLITESRRLPALLSIGWTVMPLSLPIPKDGELIEALEILIDARSVEAVARRPGAPVAAGIRSAA
jgi:N-acyl-L-homoserine lactone synthetase